MEQGKKRCLPYWNKYANYKESLFFKAAEIRSRMMKQSLEWNLNISPEDFIGRERDVVISQRVNQQAFRIMVLGNYENKCALSGIDIPELLVASHIVPWSVDESNRLNPANGICLSSLFDKMFDKGLIGIRDDYTVQLSAELKDNIGKDYYEGQIAMIENKQLRMPIEHLPDKNLLEIHYNTVFSPHN